MKYCRFLRVRSKNYKQYSYCQNKKEEVSREECSRCKDKEYIFYKSIKKKSKYLRRLEKNRKSILTENLKICYICGKKATSMHEIYKGSNRKISMINGFCVPLCDMCHRHTEEYIELLRFLQRECQEKYEETHSRDEFMKLIGRNYI